MQKHDTYFSGGKHFEYMLLNGSNVLLTSLQNDSPYDVPPEQLVSPKNEFSTKSDFTDNTIAQNKSLVQPKPVKPTNSTDKTSTINNNFTVITKLKSNHNSTWFSVNTMPEQSVTKFTARRPDFRKFEKPNISSPTKLYSKHENRSDENFASFTAPIVPKPMVSVYSDGSIPEKEEQLAQKQVYDYDDSFTKLLISNGILKPDKENGKNITDPPPEKVYSKFAKKFNGSSITNMANNSISSTYTLILKDRRPAVDTAYIPVNTTERLPSSPRNEVNFTHSPVTAQGLESPTKVNSAREITHEFSTKSSTGITITSNFVGDLNVDESPRVASAESNTLSILNKSKKVINKENKIEKHNQPKKFEENSTGGPFSRKNVFPDTMMFDEVQTENSAKPFNAHNITHQPIKISVKSFSSKPEDTSNDNYPSLAKFFPISSTKITQQNDQQNQKNVTAAEFKNLIEKSIKQLFLPVAKFFNTYENQPSPFGNGVRNFKINIEDSKDVKVTLKSFTFTNLVDVLKNKSQNHETKPKLSRFDRDLLQIKPRDSIHNWTDLNDGKVIDLEDSINELFSEDDEVHWFVLLLAGNSTVAQMRKEDFVKYLKVNLAARLSLEYNDIRINAIIVVPPNLAVNVSLPASESSVDVNEEVNVEESPKIGSIHKLAETNTTLLELSGQEYHVVQLLCLKSQQSVQNGLPQTAKVVERKHDDIEFYIFLMVGAICMFGVLSPLLYSLYKLIQRRLTTLTIKIPDVLRDKLKQPPHEKINESTCESLNVIFSEDFDRKYSSASWFDNTQHSSSILKPSTEVPPTFFSTKDECQSFSDFCDISRNPIENSPRLNKENKLNMLSCRPSCVLLPHQGRYPIDSEYDQEKYFDNPNYNHDTR